MKKLLLAVGWVCSSLMLHACGGAGSTQLQPPPPAAQLAVNAAPATTTAGTALNFTVTARGTNGAVASNYGGTVHFTSTDSQAVLPADSTLTGGTKNFSVTFKTAGGQSLSATDTVTASLAGSAPITVNAGPATKFSVTATSAATVAVPFNVTVNAMDAYMNAANNYAGTVHFTSSDPQAVLPANSAVTNGWGSFSVTLKTLGPQTVTATDTVTGSLNGSTSPINLVSNAATRLGLVDYPAGVNTRQSFKLVVWALDAANNISTSYGGTVHFTSSDAQAQLPANATLVAGVSQTLSAALETAGNQTITATDINMASITRSTTPISVTATQALTITSAPPAGTVGSGYYPHSVTWCGVGAGGHCILWVTAEAYGFPLGASGGVPPYTWSWGPAAGSAVPPGLAVANAPTTNCSAGSGGLHHAFPPCIYGTPTQLGTFNVVLTVTDAGSPSVQTPTSYAITINKPPLPVVNNAPPPPGVENQPYSFTFNASGYAPLTWSESGALPTGLAFDASSATLSGTPKQTGSFTITVTATDQFKQASTATNNFTIVVAAHGFVADGYMTAPRDLHTSTLLNGGKVLITGGRNFANPGTVTASAELYDPSAGTFSATGNMQTARVEHSATLLNDGRVLVAGGCSIELTSPLASAELYDPTGATSTATASMKTARCGHTATLLANGKVLMIGGFDSTSTSLAAAELFDPATNTFSSTGSLQTARKEHTVTLLASGKVLVTGGIDDKSNNLDSAELYDPTSGTFTTVVGMMSAARAGHTATIFTSGADAGKVLLAGGVDATGKALNTAELFDPTAQSFTASNNMTSAHAYYTANLLPDGTVLLAGGVDATGGTTSVAELFDPSSGNFSATGGFVQPREQHAATLLANGQVLATGGQDGRSFASAEVYK